MYIPCMWDAWGLEMQSAWPIIGNVSSQLNAYEVMQMVLECMFGTSVCIIIVALWLDTNEHIFLKHSFGTQISAWVQTPV